MSPGFRGEDEREPSYRRDDHKIKLDSGFCANDEKGSYPRLLSGTSFQYQDRYFGKSPLRYGCCG